MQSHVRDHMPALTGELSAISLAFVFGLRTVLGTLPIGALPRAPAGIIDTMSSANATTSPSPEVFIE